jgi:hypothetical protein
MALTIINISLPKARRILRELGTQTPDATNANTLKSYLALAGARKTKFPKNCNDPEAEELRLLWNSLLSGQPFNVTNEKA